MRKLLIVNPTRVRKSFKKVLTVFDFNHAIYIINKLDLKFLKMVDININAESIQKYLLDNFYLMTRLTLAVGDFYHVDMFRITFLNWGRMDLALVIDHVRSDEIE